jgi:hypothetical protein
MLETHLIGNRNANEITGVSVVLYVIKNHDNSRADCEGANSPRLFTTGETKALAKSKVHQ